MVLVMLLTVAAPDGSAVVAVTLATPEDTSADVTKRSATNVPLA